MERKEKHLMLVCICYKLAIQCCGVNLYFQWARDEYKKMKRQKRWFKASKRDLRAAS